MFSTLIILGMLRVMHIYIKDYSYGYDMTKVCMVKQSFMCPLMSQAMLIFILVFSQPIGIHTLGTVRLTFAKDTAWC